MAEVEQLIVAKLKATSAITAIIGSGSDCQLYSLQAPPTASMPFLVYTRQNSQRFQVMGGHTENKWDSFEFSAVAKTYSQARALIESVRESLENYSTPGPPVINWIEYDNQSDTIIDNADAEVQLFHCIMQMVIKYEE